MRDIISKNLSENHNFHTDSSDVLITSGCNAAFCIAASTIIKSSDEVILPEPYYFNHQMWLEYINARIVLAKATDNITPDINDLCNKISNRTKAIVLVSPGNPSGTTIPYNDLEIIIDIAVSKNIYVIVDETYRIFRDMNIKKPFIGKSFYEYPNLIRLLSFSKELAIPGYRVGAVCAQKKLIQEMLKIHECISVCAPNIGQLAANAAMRSHDVAIWQAARSKEIQQKIAFFSSIMSKQPGGFKELSSGGFFSWVKHPFVGINSWDIVECLIKDSRLLTLPGNIFGPKEQDKIRIGIANIAYDQIETVGQRLSHLAQI